MPTQLVHQTPKTIDVSKKQSKEKLSFIEKELDMGFFDHHHFQLKDGILVNDSCQRIKKCSCNCNDCTWFG
jgi:hypothetical protein